MNEMSKERETAVSIIDLFEQLLFKKGIKIPSDDREADNLHEACLYGSEYYELEDKITEILTYEYRKVE